MEGVCWAVSFGDDEGAQWVEKVKDQSDEPTASHAIAKFLFPKMSDYVKSI